MQSTWRPRFPWALTGASGNRARARSSGNIARRRRVTDIVKIDWRLVGPSYGHILPPDRNWQPAQSVIVIPAFDDAASMTFSVHSRAPPSCASAQTLDGAGESSRCAGGERMGLTHLAEPPRGGTAQLMRLAQALMDGHEASGLWHAAPADDADGQPGGVLLGFPRRPGGDRVRSGTRCRPRGPGRAGAGARSR